MALRANYPVVVEFERPRMTEKLRWWLAAARDFALTLSLAGGVCLAWPQIAQSMALATRIALFYLFSPR
jgi:hypothetical protein